MTHIFYSIGLLYLLYEITWIVSPKEKAENVWEFYRLQKLHKDKKWDDMPTEYKDRIKSNLWQLCLVLWVLIGIFSSQWILFLGKTVFNLLIITPLSSITRFTIAYTVLHWINSVIGFAFALFVIINHYHLRIDVWKLIVNA